MNGRTARPWLAPVLVLALSLAALGVRLFQLDSNSLWIDEVSSVEVAAQPLGDIVTKYQPGKHPWHGSEQAPLAFLIMHLFYTPEAIEFSARLPFALLGALSVPLLFLCARRLVSTPTALLAAALLTFSPLHVWYSQEARWYALWILLTTLTYTTLLAAAERPQSRAWVAYGLASILNVYTFILSFLLLACQGLTLLLLPGSRQDRRVRFGRFVSTGVTVLIASAPVLWLVLHTLGLTTGTPRPTTLAQVPYTFFAYLAGYSVGPSVAELHALPPWREILAQHPAVLVFAAVYAPLVVLGLGAVLADRQRRAVLLPWCFGPAVCVLLLSLVSNVTYQARYSSAALPAFIIVVALGIMRLGRGLRVVAVAAVLACSGYALSNHYWNPDYAKEDARGAVVALRSTPADTMVYVIGQVGPALHFYAPELRIVELDNCSDSGSGVTLQTGVAGRAWLVAGRDWEDEAPHCRARLAATHHQAEQQHVPGIELWRFEPRGE